MAEDRPLAQRVIQFPVRNAFYAQRSNDALARDPDVHPLYTEVIDAKVQGEVERMGSRDASGQRARMAGARSGAVLMMMPSPERLSLGERILTAVVRAALRLRR